MKGYCPECNEVIDEVEYAQFKGTCSKCYVEDNSYWIDGHFVRWWTNSVWFCPDRDLYVPKKHTVKLEKNRIYVNPSFARGQILLKDTKVLKHDDKNDLHLISWCKALNAPWVKEFDPPFEVSLP